MLHYNPQHVSSNTLRIFWRTNCIITASGIVTVCKQPYSMPVESGLQSANTRFTVLCPSQAICINFAKVKGMFKPIPLICNYSMSNLLSSEDRNHNFIV